MNKEVLKRDPYDIDINNPSLKEVYKDVALVSINSMGDKVIKGIRNCLVKLKKKKLLTDLKDKTIQTLIDNFKRRHKRIKNHFYSGIGVTLQYKDSKIANIIMKHFAIKGILCMCVHDSFIVPKQYEKELRKQMRAAYKSEMGYYPVIKKK